MKRLLKTTIWVIALIFSYEINASMVCPRINTLSVMMTFQICI